MGCLYSLNCRLKNGTEHGLLRHESALLPLEAADGRISLVTPKDLKDGDRVMLSLPDNVMASAAELIELARHTDGEQWETVIARVEKTRFALGFQDSTTMELSLLPTSQVYVFRDAAAVPVQVSVVCKGDIVWHAATQRYGRVQTDPVLS